MGFGGELRDLRQRAGWRQVDLVEALGGQIARSTLANIEAGRERPSERFWALLGEHLPDWVPQLTESYLAARTATTPAPSAEPPHPLAGPFIIETLQLTYVFRESRAPEEILEVRRVRATSSADGYGLKLAHTESPDFKIETESLWGGHLDEQDRHTTDSSTIVVGRFAFDRRLRRGQTHEFALRHWVARDPDPCTDVIFSMNLPTERVAIHLNFLGSECPDAVWRFGPLVDDALIPREAHLGEAVALSETGTTSAYFSQPGRGTVYGVAWVWPD